MSNIIKIKRGLKANLNNSGTNEGELKYTTDTNELFIYSGGENKNIQGKVGIDDATIEKNGNGNLQIKDNGITFNKLNSNLIATSITNSNNTLPRTDSVYKELLNNTNSSQICSFDSTSNKLQLQTIFNNNNNVNKINKTTDLLTKITDYSSLSDGDKLSFLNLSTQELKDVALSAINTYIQNKISVNNGLSKDTNGAIGHSNSSITAQTTAKLLQIQYDTYGHITGKGNGYDVLTNIGLSSTNLQIPAAKTVFDKTPQTTTEHLQAEELTTMDDFFALLVEAEDTTHVSNTTIRTGMGYVALPQFIVDDLTAIGLANVGYGNCFFKAQKVKSTADVLYGYIELQYLYGFSSAINVKNSTGWSGWKLKQCDSYAPISTSKYVSTFKSPNDCIVPFGFNRILNMANERATIEGLFVSQMTDPVDGSSNLFGDLKVRQQCYGGSTAGSATNICIEQTFETYLRGSPTQRKVFFRRGYVTNSPTDIDINNVEAIKNSLTWMNWYPLEYPNLAITLNSTVLNTENSKVDLVITGGWASFRFNNVNFKSNTGSSVTRFDNDTRLSVLGTNKYSDASTSGGYVWSTLITTDPTKSILVCYGGGNNPYLYAWGAQANVGYYGLLTVPLGY